MSGGTRVTLSGMEATEQRVVRARAPEPLIAAVEAYAARTGLTTSGALRGLLMDALGRCDLWPPPAEPLTREGSYGAP